MKYQVWVRSKIDSVAVTPIDADWHEIDGDGRLILYKSRVGSNSAQIVAVFAHWTWFQILRDAND